MKHNSSDLKFTIPLPVGAPNIGKKVRFNQLIQEILERNWLTNHGPLVQQFEAELEKYLGVEHCIVTTNGTVALELAIRALELQGEVIVPSLTFIATAHALQWQGIKPIFCDIDPLTYNIDANRIEEKINAQTTGILGVHLYGRPCDIKRLDAIAQKHNLSLLFDAAHAFGCSYQKQMIGHFGACEIFSFHATKVFNAFEGGAIATNDDDLARKIRLMQNFGFSGEDNVMYIGTNGKMTEVCAAMGLTNLESLAEFIEINRLNLMTYRQELLSVPGIHLIQYPENERNNYQYVILEIDEANFGMSRDQLKKILWQQGVLARRYFYPGCHRMEPYRSLYPDIGVTLPETEAFCDRVLALPTGTQVTPEAVSTICSIIRRASSLDK